VVPTVEISDLILDVDPETLARLPVRRGDVVDRLEAVGNRRGARLVRRLPVRAGDVLDEDAVDQLLVRVHAEIQRLSVEFQQGRRVAGLLEPLVRSLAADPRCRTVIDVGCGLGYVMRWLAARSPLSRLVELVGCDLNPALVRTAQRLAEDERLPCRFLQADAFRLDVGPAVFISNGVMHHFRGADLAGFFAAQEAAGAAAFVHHDLAPTWISPFGAWLFHWARTREPLARHDGQCSARRAYGDDELVAAVRRGSPSLVPLIIDPVGERNPVLNVMRPVIGLRPELVEPFLDRLGPLRSRAEVYA
jgi:SAM-dependent methyltransferase